MKIICYTAIINSKDNTGYATIKLRGELNSPQNIVISILENEMLIEWDDVTGALSYDIFSSNDPYGIFSYEKTVASNEYIKPVSENIKFYYIVAKK